MFIHGYKQRLESALDELARCPRPTDECPSAEVMLSAVRAELVPEAIKAIGEHALTCPSCALSWRLARDIVEGKLPPAPREQTARRPSSIPGAAALIPSASLGRWGFGAAALAGSAVMAAGVISWQQGGGEEALRKTLARQADNPCTMNEAYGMLDFWLGEWDVYVGDEKVGTNRIEKVLRGCAVMEHWTSGRGWEGKSLFYFEPARALWKQVWVTDTGPVKEKTLVGDFDGDGVRFQGSIPQLQGGAIMDRTTLTRLDDGRVRQVIEQSTDDGETWSVGFDATYVPRRR